MKAKKFGQELLDMAKEIEAKNREYSEVVSGNRSHTAAQKPGKETKPKNENSLKPLGSWNIASQNKVITTPGAVGNWNIPEVKGG